MLYVHTYTARALGSGSLESARRLLTLSRIPAAGDLYQIAHTESVVEKWDNSTPLAGPNKPKTEGI